MINLGYCSRQKLGCWSVLREALGRGAARQTIEGFGGSGTEMDVMAAGHGGSRNLSVRGSGDGAAETGVSDVSATAAMTTTTNNVNDVARAPEIGSPQGEGDGDRGGARCDGAALRMTF